LLCVGVREDLRCRCTLGDRDPSGVLHEPAELGVRDRVLVHPQVADLRLDHRLLLGVEESRAHPEPAAGHEDQLTKGAHPILPSGPPTPRVT
jgi:hypothetical protein